MHSRGGGIHGNPEAATTHLGTVTLKDSVEYLPTYHEAHRLTRGRVDRAKIAKLASKCASEMSLRMIASSALRVKVTKRPCTGPGPPPPPPSFMRQAERRTAYRRHKCPSELPRLQASFLHPKVAGGHCFEVNFA